MMSSKLKKEYLRTILKQAEKIEALQDTVDRLAAEVKAHRATFGVKTPAYTAAEQAYMCYKQELRRLRERGEPVGYEELMALVAAVQRREADNT